MHGYYLKRYYDLLRTPTKPFTNHSNNTACVRGMVCNTLLNSNSNMNIDVTFDHVKWIVSGFLVAGTTVFTWVSRLAVRHIKEQKENNRLTSLFREDMAGRVEVIISKSTEVSSQVQQLQVFMEAQFEVNPVALFICDSTGKCINANDSLLTIFHSQASEMLGFGWLNFIHPEDRGRVHDLWMRAINNQNSDVRDHYRIIDRDEYDTNGRTITLASVSYKTIFKYDSDKNLKVAVGTVWEIDKQETNDRILKCIAETLDQMKGTPLWNTMQQQIKNKNK